MSEAKRRCTLREFRRWQAYDQIEPFGEVRADLRIAILATVVAAGFGSKSAKPSDFMPRLNAEPKPKQSVSQMASMFRRYAEAHNKANKR